jgi:NADH-quinone oxidoreductase subunit I
MFNDAIALLKGFWTTVKYTARPAVTIQYPDVKRTPADKYRGRHRLYKHDDGLERCIGCSLCAAACPSQAIYVRSAENDPSRPVSPGERFAEVYEINMIRCIFCGYCEEACPVDAIKLGPEYELADFNRKDFVYTKEMLLDPATKAPKIQFHADVDRSTDSRGVHTSLGAVYRTHHPIGAPDTRERTDDEGHEPGPAGEEHGPSQAGATLETPGAGTR